MTRKRTLSLGAATLALVVATGATVWFSESVQDALMSRVIASRAVQHHELHDPDALNVVFCGTGSPLPTPERGAPCIAIYAGDELLVLDAGEGAASRLSVLRAPLGKLSAVLLTHFHSDHIGGLGDLVLQSWAAGRQSPLSAYGPEGVAQVTEGVMATFAQDASYRTAHHGPALMPPTGGQLAATSVAVPDAGEAVTVFERAGLRVQAFRVDHSPVHPAYGFRVDYRGRAAIFSGDTIQQDILARVGAGADVMVHEALAPHMMLAVAAGLEAAGDAQRAQIVRDTLSYHATPVQAAETANAAQVGLLVFSHIVPSPPNAVAERVFLRGVSDVRDTGVVLGFDGLWVELPVGSTAIHQHDLR